LGKLLTIVLAAIAVEVAVAGNHYSFQDSGSCGRNVSWTFFSREATLVVHGKGRLEFCTGINKDKVENIVIKDGVTAIGPSAFSSFTMLKSVDIADTVTEISGEAFYQCVNLTSMIIPNYVETIGKRAFASCTQLKSVSIGKSLVTIEEEAFKDCTSLKSMKIPRKVETIGDRAFAHCSNLTSVTIGGSVKTIGREAFSRSGLLSVIIPDSVESIAMYAFNECSNLQAVVIGKSVSYLGSMAFFSCSELSSATFYGDHDLKADAPFLHCNKLTFVCVPSSYTDSYFCSLPVEKTCNP